MGARRLPQFTEQAQTALTGGRDMTQKSRNQVEAREKFSLGAMVLTIVIANALAFIYMAPYA